MSSKASSKRETSADSTKSNLDTKVANVTVKTIAGIKRYRITLIVLIVLVSLLGVGVWAARELRVAAERRLSGAAHWLFYGPGSGEEEVLPKVPGITQLLADAKGKAGERRILKSAVAYLIDGARRELVRTPVEGESKRDTAEKILGVATRLIDEGKARFPEDEEFQLWARSNQEAIDSLDKYVGRERTERAFRPILPPNTKPPEVDASSATGGEDTQIDRSEES